MAMPTTAACNPMLNTPLMQLASTMDGWTIASYKNGAQSTRDRMCALAMQHMIKIPFIVLKSDKVSHWHISDA